MRSKDYLSQAFALKKEIERLERQIENLTTLVEKCTSTITDMPRPASPALDSRERLVCRTMDLRHEKNRKLDQFVEALQELDDTIGKVKDSRERLVLELRYIDLNSWERISEIMECSKRTIYRIHGAGLMAVEKILEKS